MKTVATALACGALLVSSLALAQEDRFKSADANGDGALTLEEVTAAAPDTTADKFAAVDLDGNGTLSYDEFELGVEEGYIALN